MISEYSSLFAPQFNEQKLPSGPNGSRDRSAAAAEKLLGNRAVPRRSDYERRI